MQPIFSSFAPIVLSLLSATIGGFFAKSIGAPMPYLLGAFLLSAAISMSGFKPFGVKPELPMPLRNLFVAVIGVMIGGSFTPEIFQSLGQILIPMGGVVLFVFASLGMNYALFRKIGGYDRATAFYSALPGGLIESIALGEKAGGDPQALSLQQFSRIALVITTLPFLFLVFTGEKVGSADGMTLTPNTAEISLRDVLILLFCAVAGLYGGKIIRLPAAILVGPMILSGFAHFYGFTLVGPPSWAISIAQVIVGAGLGTRFAGFQGSQVIKAIGLAVISVTLMLLLDVGLVFALRHIIDMPFEVLFVSFAPGGVSETSLIALSLNANPVFVTSLHVLRIIVTVVICSFSAKFIKRI